MGWDADLELSKMIIEELTARDLARPSQDAVSVPLHPMVRMTFLVLLSQLARDAGRRTGLSLHPATTKSDAIEDLIQVLSLPASHSVGHVVTLDLEAGGVNLATVPLEEILEFRDQHGASYKVYARNVRHLIAELGLFAPDEREALLADRREGLEDLANDLRRTARRRWRSLATLSIGAAGAAWLAAGPLHDPLGGALALAGATLGFVQEEPPATACSYVLDAQANVRQPEPRICGRHRPAALAPVPLRPVAEGRGRARCRRAASARLRACPEARGRPSGRIEQAPDPVELAHHGREPGPRLAHRIRRC
jgi:hypothetical protein